MNLTFRQLRLFLALADTGSVSAAARALHVTQPTASMQLKEITQSIGMPVYEVVGKRVFLTEAGRELAETARAIAGEWEALRQKFDASTQSSAPGFIRPAGSTVAFSLSNNAAVSGLSIDRYG